MTNERVSTEALGSSCACADSEMRHSEFFLMLQKGREGGDDSCSIACCNDSKDSSIFSVLAGPQ